MPPPIGLFTLLVSVFEKGLGGCTSASLFGNVAKGLLLIGSAAGVYWDCFPLSLDPKRAEPPKGVALREGNEEGTVNIGLLVVLVIGLG